MYIFMACTDGITVCMCLCVLLAANSLIYIWVIVCIGEMFVCAYVIYIYMDVFMSMTAYYYITILYLLHQAVFMGVFHHRVSPHQEQPRKKRALTGNTPIKCIYKKQLQNQTSEKHKFIKGVALTDDTTSKKQTPNTPLLYSTHALEIVPGSTTAHSSSTCLEHLHP